MATGSTGFKGVDYFWGGQITCRHSRTSVSGGGKAKYFGLDRALQIGGTGGNYLPVDDRLWNGGDQLGDCNLIFTDNSGSLVAVK